MKENKKENIFSRFLNVFGIIVIGISVFIIIYLTHYTLSTRDNENSFIRCNNGKEFSLNKLSSVGIVLYYNSKEFEYDNDRLVKTVCLLSEDNSEIKKIIGENAVNKYSLSDISKKIFIPDNKNYNLFIHTVKEGSEEWIIIYCILGIIGSYFVVNLIREVILYIFFGKKLSKDILKPFN